MYNEAIVNCSDTKKRYAFLLLYIAFSQEKQNTRYSDRKDGEYIFRFFPGILILSLFFVHAIINC